MCASKQLSFSEWVSGYFKNLLVYLVLFRLITETFIVMNVVTV